MSAWPAGDSDEARMERAEDALRDICLLVTDGEFDPSDGEGTSPQEVMELVQKGREHQHAVEKELRAQLEQERLARKEIEAELTRTKASERLNANYVRSFELERDELRAKCAELEKEHDELKMDLEGTMASEEAAVAEANKLLEQRQRDLTHIRQLQKELIEDDPRPLHATLTALQQRCAQWQSEAESNAGLLLDTREAGERLIASIDSIRTMLYGLVLDLRQAAIAQRAIDEAVDAKRLWNERAALAPDAGSGQQKLGVSILRPIRYVAEADSGTGTAEGGAKP